MNKYNKNLHTFRSIGQGSFGELGYGSSVSPVTPPHRYRKTVIQVAFYINNNFAFPFNFLFLLLYYRIRLPIYKMNNTQIIAKSIVLFSVELFVCHSHIKIQ